MIRITNISKSFDSEPVLSNISFNLEEGKTLSVLGKSGCGKTTLLKIIAGIHENYSGSIEIDGSSIDHLKPKDRGAVYLYQEPLLFPHLNVEQNIAFGLQIRKENPELIKEKTTGMIRQLHLEGQEHKMPGQLSGGQKQRVAFGRAFIIHPRVLLLDEPFGSLDTDTRKNMQELFVEISNAEKITTVFVTHDVKEALLTGNRFALMQDGDLKVFKSRKEFIEDARSGVKNELQFWNNLLFFFTFILSLKSLSVNVVFTV